MFGSNTTIDGEGDQTKKRKIYLLRVGFLTNSLQMDHCMNDCWIRYKLVFSSVDCCSIECIDFLSTNTVPLLGDIDGSDAKKNKKNSWNYAGKRNF